MHRPADRNAVIEDRLWHGVGPGWMLESASWWWMRAMICFSRLGYLGQLGNQLFQVAATLAAAKRFGTNAKFPHWKYAQFFQGRFDQTLSKDEIAETYVEKTAHFNSIPDRPNLDLFGFFQSHRYFSDEEPLIRNAFAVTEDLVPAPWRDAQADCSIHVRRKDYLARSHKYVPLQMDYYDSAIKYMRERGCSRFLLFSDDVEWCKNNFPGDIKIVDGLTDIQSLSLMSQCNHHIIANSTFSWWGSWLGNEDRDCSPTLVCLLLLDAKERFLSVLSGLASLAQ
jgi:hypothetical protein